MKEDSDGREEPYMKLDVEYEGISHNSDTEGEVVYKTIDDEEEV